MHPARKNCDSKQNSFISRIEKKLITVKCVPDTIYNTINSLLPAHTKTVQNIGNKSAVNNHIFYFI